MQDGVKVYRLHILVILWITDDKKESNLKSFSAWNISTIKKRLLAHTFM